MWIEAEDGSFYNADDFTEIKVVDVGGAGAEEFEIIALTRKPAKDAASLRFGPGVETVVLAEAKSSEELGRKRNALIQKLAIGRPFHVVKWGSS